jgi:biopolymer transport protein ExbD
MTATNGDTSKLASGINVAPMIDVLLVLLIIFMVIVPAVPRGEAALAPRSSLRGTPGDAAVVLEVMKAADNAIEYRINQQRVAQGELQSRLAAIYANRAQRVLFVKGDGALSFTQIAEVVDMGHAVGVDQIGLMTPKVLAGQ